MAADQPSEGGHDMTQVLQLKGLEKCFGANKVLKGIDLDVSEGEVIALIGASGSGKSTLLRCINRLETPTAGKVSFEGKEITGDNETEVRKRIGMVFQRFAIDLQGFVQPQLPLHHGSQQNGGL